MGQSPSTLTRRSEKRATLSQRERDIVKTIPSPRERVAHYLRSAG